jgi:hypothetical protein
MRVIPGWWTKRQKGQSLVETAIISVVAVLILVAFISLIPISRARTAATSAALACAQALSQSRDPSTARTEAYTAAMAVLKGGWSGTGSAQYSVEVNPPGGPGEEGTCRVRWNVILKYLPFSLGWSAESFTSRNESWRSRWDK